MNISLKKKKPTIALISSSILASVSLLLPLGTINAGHKREWLQSNPESLTPHRFNIINSGNCICNTLSVY